MSELNVNAFSRSRWNLKKMLGLFIFALKSKIHEKTYKNNLKICEKMIVYGKHLIVKGGNAYGVYNTTLFR